MYVMCVSWKRMNKKQVNDDDDDDYDDGDDEHIDIIDIRWPSSGVGAKRKLVIMISTLTR